MKYAILSSNMKLLMKHSELTAKGFADKFKVSQGAIESYAGGRNKPKLDLMDKICNFYSISHHQLLKQKLTEQDLKVSGSIETVTEVKLASALREIELLKKALKDKDLIIELLQKRQ